MGERATQLGIEKCGRQGVAVVALRNSGHLGRIGEWAEMAARAGTGIEIELDKVPQRAPNMSSYEIMLSESQERMLIVVHKGREEEVKRIFDKWDLPWAEIGKMCIRDRPTTRSSGNTATPPET